MSNNKYTDEELVALFKWFNETQWRGGKGDPIKVMFCKSDYKGLVKQALKELNLNKDEQEES